MIGPSTVDEFPPADPHVARVPFQQTKRGSHFAGIGEVAEPTGLEPALNYFRR